MNSQSFDAGLRQGVRAYKDCWSNIYSCLSKGERYISPEDLNLLYSAAEACESSLFYIIYNPGQLNQSAKLTSLTCFNVARFCSKYQSDPQMERCARSLDTFAQTCLVFMKPNEV